MKKDEFDGESVTENTVTVSGTAYNAKAGAVLESDDGRVIYVEGLKRWDDELVENRVRLTGILSKKKPFPDIKAVGGVQMQGMSGTTWVLRLTEPYKK